jgi:integrase
VDPSYVGSFPPASWKSTEFLVARPSGTHGKTHGLIWENLDRDALSRRQSIGHGKGGAWIEGTPKTASGRRSIALTASVVNALRRHRVAQVERRLAIGPVWDDFGFVFTNETGGPLHVNALDLRFRRLTDAANVPCIRPHGPRHTSATLTLANGEHPKIVQERLGHADISMTMRYSHVSMGMQRDAANRLDVMLAADDGTGREAAC